MDGVEVVDFVDEVDTVDDLDFPAVHLVHSVHVVHHVHPSLRLQPQHRRVVVVDEKIEQPVGPHADVADPVAKVA